MAARQPFAVLFRLVRDVAQHVGDGGAVLRVEVGVDFVEEVEGRGVALLDREDEGEGAETWMFLVSRSGSGAEQGEDGEMEVG